MPNTADGKYNRRAWDAPAEAAYPPQAYIGPFASNQERLLSQSLAAYTMSGPELQNYVRPPLPQVQLFPDKFGYHMDEIGIKDVVTLSGRVQQRNESDFSQTPNTTQSSSRNTLGTV